jgi:hypothetical protein
MAHCNDVALDPILRRGKLPLGLTTSGNLLKRGLYPDSVEERTETNSPSASEAAVKRQSMVPISTSWPAAASTASLCC